MFKPRIDVIRQRKVVLACYKRSYRRPVILGECFRCQYLVDVKTDHILCGAPKRKAGKDMAEVDGRGESPASGGSHEPGASREPADT